MTSLQQTKNSLRSAAIMRMLLGNTISKAPPAAFVTVGKNQWSVQSENKLADQDQFQWFEFRFVLRLTYFKEF